MSDNMDEPENNEVSFTDEVEQAIDNLQLPDDTAAQFVDDDKSWSAPSARHATYEDGDDLKLDTDKPRTVLIVDNDPRGKGISDEVFKEWARKYNDNPYAVDFDESPAKTPPEATIAAQSHDGFEMFKAGFDTCLGKLQDFLDEHKNDDDFIAIIFNQFIAGDAVSQQIAETTAWANHVDVSDGALIPKTNELSGTFAPQVLDAETEKKQLDLGSQDLFIAGQSAPGIKDKATRRDFSPFTRDELELMLSEALTVNEAVEQHQQRDELLPGLWAAITDYFNGVMADQPESQLDEPLVVRIQMFNERLRNESWHWQNKDHLNEPDFYELPPILMDFLINQPESQYSLLPGFQLVSLINRYRNGFEAAQRAANILNVIPAADGYDVMIEKLKDIIEDAARWHTSQNQE
jgi:hypothetical protein